MKYEMIFGDENMFEGVGLFTGMDIITRNIDDGLYIASLKGGRFESDGGVLRCMV